VTLYWHDWAGYIGVVLVLLAFFLLQAHKLRGNGLVYQLMNALGALGVMLSLLFGHFNMPAFIMQVAWLVISIFGVARGMRVRREARDSGHKTSPW
jgi:paired small multidrug resistance pump